MANTKFETQEDNNQNTSFLNVKNHIPPDTKAHNNKHQTQPKMPTPTEVVNTRFYQLSLDISFPNESLGNPRIKPRPLTQHNKSKHM
jgi:hypothetical protein